MFDKLRDKIIIITMTATTAVLVLASSAIMVFSSATRPAPESYLESITINVDGSGFIPPDPSDDYGNQALEKYIKIDRDDGRARLLTTLLSVSVAIEIIVFLIVYYLSGKIVKPVENAYGKQKLFIANASHELKTPLAVIQANIEALEVDKDNEKWKNNIENEITHANKLVLDLLQLARMDAGSSGQKLAEDVNLASELKKRIEIFKPKFAGKITFKTNNKTKVYLLPKQDILQIVDILLDNATKYGERKILVTLEQNSISVVNDGVKISKADFGKIFDRFYQTDKTREGSGLGLAIAKAICEQNKWGIVCKNNTDGLTEFKVTF